MGAKDTVMSQKQLSKINSDMPSEAKYGEVFEVIADKQAELSFKAGEQQGILKVVKWIEENGDTESLGGVSIINMDAFRSFLQKNLTPEQKIVNGVVDNMEHSPEVRVMNLSDISPEILERRPKLLDLFCGAGGAAVGYYRAGFQPYGIDNKPQKHYPFPFLLMDALEAMDRLLRGEGLIFNGGETLYLKDFAAIHASPPCQGYIHLKNGEDLNGYPLLIDKCRDLLIATGKPFSIENVPSAKAYLINPIMLCGTMFGLPIWKHRYFETNPLIYALLNTCNHKLGDIDSPFGKIAIPVQTAHGGDSQYHERPSRIGIRWRPAQALSLRRWAMGVENMSRKELAEAIPPAYTEYIGKWLWRIALTLNKE